MQLPFGLSPAATTVDLTNCDREPIHIPGAVQPHGVFVAFTESDGLVVAASANAGALLGVEADALSGRPLASIVDREDAARLATQLAAVPAGALDALPVTAGTPAHRARWMALVHRHDGVGILELEPVDPPRDGTNPLLALGTAARLLQATHDPVDACGVVAALVRQITGFDRVKIYRFAADWSGEVLAEARDDAMPSYLGLHFPPSDIPAQARTLYQTNPVRLIADVDYVPSPIVPDRNPATGAPIDLRYAALRSVSPIHLEYLRNMGVGASMSAAIVRRDRLWGLIACHHRTPMRVGFEKRQACFMLAQLLAAQLDAIERVARARRTGRVEAMRSNLLAATATGDSVPEAIERTAAEWLRLVDATGFAMTRPDRITSTGVVPSADFLRTLTGWLAADSDADSVALDRLGAIFPDAAIEAPHASGLLAVPLSRTEGSYLLWFRPEQLQSVTWAGRPEKVERALPRGEQLHPRASFQAWTEQVRGRSTDWSRADVAAALQLREVVLDLFVREKDELERRNMKLALSARELETFIYVASHDIKEPLRQMEMLTSLLAAHLKPEAADEARAYHDEFATVARRLRALTEQLALYARLGRAEPPDAPVALAEVVEEVAVELRAAIAASGMRIDVATLPTVSGDRTQLHQVFVNLIGNAIKYRAADREPRVEIRGSVAAADDDAEAPGAMRRIARITVADNGIGFDPKYDDQIFEAFLRLHPRDRYEGSGIGLAICRRIVERHRGRITAHGEPGAGAVFTMTLPSRADRGRGVDGEPR